MFRQPSNTQLRIQYGYSLALKLNVLDTCNWISHSLVFTFFIAPWFCRNVLKTHVSPDSHRTCKICWTLYINTSRANWRWIKQQWKVTKLQTNVSVIIILKKSSLRNNTEICNCFVFQSFYVMVLQTIQLVSLCSLLMFEFSYKWSSFSCWSSVDSRYKKIP